VQLPLRPNGCGPVDVVLLVPDPCLPNTDSLVHCHAQDQGAACTFKVSYWHMHTYTCTHTYAYDTHTHMHDTQHTHTHTHANTPSHIYTRHAQTHMQTSVVNLRGGDRVKRS